MNRQVKWQLKQKEKGNCIQCGKKKKEKTILCKDCMKKQVATNKKYHENKNRGSK